MAWNQQIYKIRYTGDGNREQARELGGNAKKRRDKRERERGGK